MFYLLQVPEYQTPGSVVPLRTFCTSGCIWFYGWQRLAHKLIADLCPRILPREEQNEDESRSRVIIQVLTKIQIQTIDHVAWSISLQLKRSGTKIQGCEVPV